MCSFNSSLLLSLQPYTQPASSWTMQVGESAITNFRCTIPERAFMNMLCAGLGEKKEEKKPDPSSYPSNS